ncbi:MAG: cell division protein SepF [Ruminococcus sp.]|nr:cell division protein SepF [Ruminococcus sp.]
MKLFENIKDFFFAAEDEEADFADSPIHGDPRAERAAAAFEHEEAVAAAEGGSSSSGRRNKVVNIQTTAQLQVVLVKPSAFTDAKQIADHLIAKKTVVLNLETASPENKRRIIDFLVGVAYANGGSLKPVANLTYIITPYNVGFIGEDLVGELENNGVFI